MNKTRLEAFSDGVIAILITIMVLELHAPEDTHFAALRHLLPAFLSYLLSFVYVGIYWNNHHHTLHATTRISGRVLWANHHLLFWLSLVPFATAWMGQDHAAPLPTAIYGCVMLGAAMAYTTLVYSIIVAEGPSSRLKAAIGKDWKGKVSAAAYAGSIPLAFVHTTLSHGVFLGIAVLWFIPDPRIERNLHH